MKKNRNLGSISLVTLIAGLLALSGAIVIAADHAPLTPELAARKEMVRKQQEQRITPEKRKAAVEALKAERLKINKARQAAHQHTPVTSDNK